MRKYLLTFLLFFALIVVANESGNFYPQVDNISGYEGHEPFVLETASGTWYALNNLGKYEKWGIVEQTDQLNTLTTYPGKYALAGGTIYRFENTWQLTDIPVRPFVKPSNGVYIIDKCGNLINSSEYTPDVDAIAVAVFTTNVSAMISKRNVLGDTDIWNKGGELIPVIWGESGLVNGVARTAANGSNANPGAVVNDFAGFNNTRLINQALNSPNNSAVKMAANYVFDNGIHGYLPAFGELNEVKAVLANVNNALSIIGGKPLDGLYWSSSQHYLNYRAWWVQMGTGHDNNQHFAALRNNHTPLSSTYYNACYALLRPYGKLPEYTFENPYPLIPEDITSSLLGDVNQDGKVDVTDVSYLIASLLSSDTMDISLPNADCDFDGVLSIGDVTELIDYLRRGYWSWDEPVKETFTVNGVTFSMITVTGGTFTMGATAEQANEAESDEKPAHEVTLSKYSIGETEVTQALWVAVMGSNPSNFKGDLNRPVEYVSWNACQEFISKLNAMTGRSFRLPTEAEWEFAARGGNLSQGYKYSGSNTIAQVAWYSGNSGSKTHPVATKIPNELGLYDMSGNVSEWCSDWYGSYSGDNQINPIGPESGSKRVNHGGSWYDGSTLCRVSNREMWTPSSAAPYGTLGLRLALDLNDPSDFGLSKNEVVLEMGKTDTIIILNGSGNYTVEGGSECISIVLNGNQLILTGMALGSTTLKISDVTAHETAFIVVSVINPATPQSQTFTVNGVTFKVIGVEGGTFTMGATAEQGNSDPWDTEYPTHQVTVSDFCIGENQVTQALWVAVMGNNPSRFTGDLNRPVDQVTWNESQTFISKLNEITGQQFRLPTEAEWEFAARGGVNSKGYKYAGSNSIGDVAWYSGNASSKTHPVATKAPNELGLYDMSGNLYDFCSDWYGNYTSDAQVNPIGPSSGTTRISRGGCWYGVARYSRISHRRGVGPTERRSDQGLRLAL